MDFPADRAYSSDHLWVQKQDDGSARVGISDYAQDQLGRVIFVDLPAAGDALSAGEEMGAVESAKSVSDLIAPLSGQVREINATLADQPGLINDHPYDQGWLVVVEPEGDPLADLMTAQEYRNSLDA